MRLVAAFVIAWLVAPAAALLIVGAAEGIVSGDLHSVHGLEALPFAIFVVALFGWPKTLPFAFGLALPAHLILQHHNKTAIPYYLAAGLLVGGAAAAVFATTHKPTEGPLVETALVAGPLGLLILKGLGSVEAGPPRRRSSAGAGWHDPEPPRPSPEDRGEHARPDLAGSKSRRTF
jgi:hypothetical protein